MADGDTEVCLIILGIIVSVAICMITGYNDLLNVMKMVFLFPFLTTLIYYTIIYGVGQAKELHEKLSEEK